MTPGVPPQSLRLLPGRLLERSLQFIVVHSFLGTVIITTPTQVVAAATGASVVHVSPCVSQQLSVVVWYLLVLGLDNRRGNRVLVLPQDCVFLVACSSAVSQFRCTVVTPRTAPERLSWMLGMRLMVLLRAHRHSAPIEMLSSVR